jgi:hypothetical protein
MSNTIAHRRHVHHHVPLLPVAAAIVIAAAVIYAVNQPQEVTITTVGSDAVTVPLIAPNAVAVPESPVFRHAFARRQLSGAELQAFKYGRLQQVDDATLDPVGTTPYGSTPCEQSDKQRGPSLDGAPRATAGGSPPAVAVCPGYAVWQSGSGCTP